jgi:hypothetical protein
VVAVYYNACILLYVQFTHDDYFSKPFPLSTVKHDYRPPCDPQLNTTDRVRFRIEQDRGALPTDRFFRHHGKRHNCNWITWYDETYNRRRFTDECGRMNFPKERTWSVLEDQWLPEQSDYPLQGALIIQERHIIKTTRYNLLFDRHAGLLAIV